MIHVLNYHTFSRLSYSDESSITMYLPSNAQITSILGKPLYEIPDVLVMFQTIEAILIFSEKFESQSSQIQLLTKPGVIAERSYTQQERLEVGTWQLPGDWINFMVGR